MSKKVLKLAGRRRTLLALIVMATITIGLLFSGWLTPTPGRAQQGGGNGGSNQENTNCVATTNAWSGTCPTIITNGSVSPTSIIVCYSNAPTMPTNIIAPVYSPTNIFTQLITYDSTNCETVTNTENVTYTVSGVFWTNISTSPYTNFPAHVTNQFSADADVYVTSSDSNLCSSPGLVNLATVTWYPVQVSVDAPQYDPDTMNGGVKGMDSCGCGLGDSTIWWFNGESPTGYDLSTTATVTGAPSGATIAWTVTGPATPKSGSGSSITLTGTGPSTEHGVEIIAKVNGTQVCAQFLTVLAPQSLFHLADGDAKNNDGYNSYIWYEIRDQFDHVLPSVVPVSEDIDGNGLPSTAAQVSAAAKPDYTGENWPWGAEIGNPSADPTYWCDTITIQGSSLSPHCQNPANPPGSTKVDHSPNGAWYCGSATSAKGVKVLNCVWQRYTDHGRHLYP